MNPELKAELRALSSQHGDGFFVIAPDPNAPDVVYACRKPSLEEAKVYFQKTSRSVATRTLALTCGVYPVTEEKRKTLLEQYSEFAKEIADEIGDRSGYGGLEHGFEEVTIDHPKYGKLSGYRTPLGVFACRKATVLDSQRYEDKYPGSDTKYDVMREFVRSARVLPEQPADADSIMNAYPMLVLRMVNNIKDISGRKAAVVDLEGN